ncbi:MAG: hypothetical protein IPP80_13005 [Ignavibacteria bacterium]|nr:hypothetical protein [Ignavibacteria bacterium]
MIKLLALTSLQAILGVGGIAMLTRALHGKPMELRVITTALFTIEGMIGAVILFGSFIVMSVILSFAKMSVYIPLNTALTFLVTIILTCHGSGTRHPHHRPGHGPHRSRA